MVRLTSLTQMFGEDAVWPAGAPYMRVAQKPEYRWGYAQGGTCGALSRDRGACWGAFGQSKSSISRRFKAMPRTCRGFIF